MKFKKVLREAVAVLAITDSDFDGSSWLVAEVCFRNCPDSWRLHKLMPRRGVRRISRWSGRSFCALHKDAVTSFKAGRGWIAKSDLSRYLRQKYQESLFASGSHYPRQMLRVHIGVSWRPGRDPGSLSSRFTSASCRLWLRLQH
jgi:hypothetical protein